ncbi:MAG: hypothetical protein GY708_05710 [Actinomycetia bacterium]|nr:hypothetical protein [Actinomycetes bacterium]
MKRLIFALVCMAAVAAPVAINLNNDATPPFLASQHEPTQLPALGPLTQIVLIYGDNVTFDATFCTNMSAMVATIGLDDLNAPAGQQIDPVTVQIQVTDFDGGGLTDSSQVHATEIEILAFNTGCADALPGAVAATVTGSFTDGQNFSIQVLAP